MSKRKNLNDLFGPRNTGHVVKATDSWDAFEAKQGKKAADPYWQDDDWSTGYGNGVYSKGYYSAKSKGKYIPRCYESHPPLQLPGTGLLIYGGSCSSPIVDDADIYVGFDYSMKLTERHWPWKKGDEVYFNIPDMGIPAKPDEFGKLVSWVRKQIEKGAKVHAGCIGGHGRTGTFLAALVSTYGEKDAIAYVRKHYCEKAVESAVQVDFLADQFGITKDDAYKGYKPAETTKGSGKSYYTPAKKTEGFETYSYVQGNGEIW